MTIRVDQQIEQDIKSIQGQLNALRHETGSYNFGALTFLLDLAHQEALTLLPPVPQPSVSSSSVKLQ
jgi:hypothetical protein